LPFKGPFFERFFIKFPMALGDLLLAYASGLLVRDLLNDEQKRLFVEKAILFNPFVILISSIWGMFDALVAAFFVLSLFYFNREEYLSGSFFYAISVLIKQTTVFFLPLIFFILLKRTNVLRTMLYIVFIALIGLIVCLPFYISEPKGFLQQVLLLHANRPPWGYNAYTVFYFSLVLFAGTVIINNLLARMLILAFISTISFTMLFVTILFLSVSFYKGGSKKGNELVYYSLLIALTFIFLNKVTNEQYFIYSLSLLLIYSVISNKENLTRLYKDLSFYLFISTMIASMRFIYFIPADILVALVGRKNAEALWQLTPIFGETNLMVVATLIVGIFIILSPFLSLAKFYIKEVRVRLGVNITPKWFLDRIKSLKIKTFLIHVGKYRNMLLIGMILMASYEVSSTLAIYKSFGSNNFGYAEKEYRLGIHYMWLENPTHDPTKKEGSWTYSFLTPLEGFYESKTPYIDEDFELIKDAGIDTIVAEVFPGKSAAFLSLVELAKNYNLSIVPYVDINRFLNLSYLDFIKPDLGDGNHLDDYYSLKSSTWAIILNTIEEVLSIYDDPSLIRVNNKPLIIIDGVYNIYPGFGPDEINYQIDKLFDYYNVTYFNETILFDTLSERWNTTISNIGDIISLYPKNVTQLLNSSDIVSSDFLTILKYSFKMFWLEIKKELDENDKSIYMAISYYNDSLNIFTIEDYLDFSDCIFLAHKAYIDSIIKGEDLNKLFTLSEKISRVSSGKLNYSITYTVFLSKNTTSGILPHYYDYNVTWINALNKPSNLTIIYSWNNYMIGAVIEPTIELGESPLKITKYYSILLNKLNEELYFYMKHLFALEMIQNESQSCCRRRINKSR